MAFKYVVLRAANRELPIIFPGSFTHSWVADAIRMMMVAEANELAGGHLPTETQMKLHSGIKVVSAGEITLGAIPNCHGGSSTLKVMARPGNEDGRLINLFPYFHGSVPEEEG